ncbi:MAG: nuclear transport factor 2 family protein [Alphaproteobacteria bacterium]|jgi:ketosteroid isomerase-like protein|nr:nuclear transport factor 2 family protein [Alphaproteobacteria bacterium]
MPIDTAERERRRALLRAHLAAENDGDVHAVMETFAGNAVMYYNTVPFPTGEAIRAAHEYIGFARGQGAFAGARNVVERESFTDTDIIVEGRLCGVHQGEFLGFAPTGKPVELPFIAIYCFGADGKLASERVVMNLGPLHENFYPAPA